MRLARGFEQGAAKPGLRPSRPLRRALLLACVALLFPMAAQIPAAAQATGVLYDLIISCPGAPTGQFGNIPPNSLPTCPVRAIDPQDEMGDPTLAVDPANPDHLVIASLHGTTYDPGGGGIGSPGIVVSAGSCPTRGPTPKSRCGQAFTTFTSEDAGANWGDNPFFPPDKVGRDAFGETPALTIDPYGHVFVGSLYAAQAADGIFDYTIAAQKFSDLNNINRNQGAGNGQGGGTGDYNAEYLKPVFEGNKIHHVWFLFDPVQDNMTLVWTEELGTAHVCTTDLSHTTINDRYVKGGTQASVWQETNGIPDLQTPETCVTNPDTQTLVNSASAGLTKPSTKSGAAGKTLALGALAHTSIPQSVATLLPLSLAPENSTQGNSTTQGNATAQGTTTSSPPNGNVTATAREHPPANDTTPRHSVIGIAWTGTSVNDTYEYQPRNQAIGPCSTSTNPVLSEGFLYIGCVADPKEGNFTWDLNAAPGTVEMFRMDPSGGKPEYIGPSPVVGGAPKLGVRSDGRLALLTANATKQGIFQLGAAFGHYESETGRVEWGPLQAYGDKITKANPAERVVGANVQDLIYREYSGVVHFILKQNVVATGIGVSALQSSAAPHIRKSLIALDEKYGVLYKHNLDIGTYLNRSNDPAIATAPEASYDDIADDFLQLPAGNFTFQGQPMGDYYQREFFAVGDYGQVLFAELVEKTELRGPAALPIQAAVPAIAAPAGATSATGALLPAAGLAVTGLLATSFFVNRRKNPLAAFVKGGKK